MSPVIVHGRGIRRDEASPPELITDGGFVDGLTNWDQISLDYSWIGTSSGYFGYGAQLEVGGGSGDA